MSEDLLTSEQLAERLHISERKLYEMCRESNRKDQKIPIPVIKLGRERRFSAASIDKWLAQIQETA
jgi:excisionase family DNA binding protein